MKLRTDDRARLYGRDMLKPNTDYLAETDGNRIVLVEMVPKEVQAARPRLVKKHGYTVAVGDHPITQAEVRKALDEFP
ncbi:MAG TPA: hypothetical protein VN873_03430 [Candidatus Angelobacter sp.]|nr:hypothetical protein [Candidatus Angelobacter sp.]